MAMYTVTIINDENDGNFSAGDLSLREAIQLANSTVGPDTITFDAGLSGSTLRLTQGELVINQAVTIDGDLDDDNAPDIIITGDANGDDVIANGLTSIFSTGAGALSDNSRVFNINSISAATTLDGLIITGGHTSNDSAPYTGQATYGGGGVRSIASLTITNSVVSGNSTAGSYSYGGAIFSYGATSISNTEISGNQTTGYSSAGGAVGIYATLDLSNSTVTNNRAIGNDSAGGAIAAYGNITIADSVISGNQTTGSYSYGGGVYGYRDITVRNSEVSGNETTGYGGIGGGLSARGNVSLTGSSVSSNSTSGFGASGGGVAAYGSTTVTGSIIHNNSVTGYFAGGGGLVAINSATIVNSTIAGNSTHGNLGAGGGVVSSVLSISNSTITGNSTAGALGVGGGAVAYGSATVTNSIILGNFSTVNFGYGVALRDNELIVADPYTGIGTVTFIGANIVGSNAATYDASVSPNVFNANAGTVFDSTSVTLTDNNGDGTPETATGVVGGQVADNGGSIQTVALNSGASNPALNAALGNLPADSMDLDNDGNTFEPIPVDARGAGFARTSASGPIWARSRFNPLPRSIFQQQGMIPSPAPWVPTPLTGWRATTPSPGLAAATFSLAGWAMMF